MKSLVTFILLEKLMEAAMNKQLDIVERLLNK